MEKSTGGVSLVLDLLTLVMAQGIIPLPKVGA